MPIFGNAVSVVRPNQENSAGDELALAVEEVSGIVEGTIKRRSTIEGWIPVKTVKGTTTVTNHSVGEATLQKLTPGEAPDGSPADFGRNSVTVDTVVLSRNALPMLDVLQTSFDARKEIGMEQGKKIAKFYDESFYIQAAKAAQLATSPYGSAGHGTGNVQTFAAAGDILDPAKLYDGVVELFKKFEAQDVEPQMEDIMLVLKPAEFYTLLHAEQIINGEYVTADGTSFQTMIFKALGCPVVKTNSIPAGQNITGHFLSNTRNSNAYDGDFSKLVGLAFSARALLAGATIPLTTQVWWSDAHKVHFIDSWLAYAVTPNRPEFAGALMLP